MSTLAFAHCTHATAVQTSTRYQQQSVQCWCAAPWLWLAQHLQSPHYLTRSWGLPKQQPITSTVCCGCQLLLCCPACFGTGCFGAGSDTPLRWECRQVWKTCTPDAAGHKQQQQHRQAQSKFRTGISLLIHQRKPESAGRRLSAQACCYSNRQDKANQKK